MQASNPAVAIRKWVDPSQAVVGCRSCYNRSLTAARATVNRSPATDKSGERLRDRSLVPPNSNPRLTNDTWDHDGAIGQAQILLREPSEQFLMQPDQGIGSVKRL